MCGDFINRNHEKQANGSSSADEHAIHTRLTSRMTTQNFFATRTLEANAIIRSRYEVLVGKYIQLQKRRCANLSASHLTCFLSAHQVLRVATAKRGGIHAFSSEGSLCTLHEVGLADGLKRSSICRAAAVWQHRADRQGSDGGHRHLHPPTSQQAPQRNRPNPIALKIRQSPPQLHRPR